MITVICIVCCRTFIWQGVARGVGSFVRRLDSGLVQRERTSWTMLTVPSVLCVAERLFGKAWVVLYEDLALAFFKEKKVLNHVNSTMCILCCRTFIWKGVARGVGSFVRRLDSGLVQRERTSWTGRKLGGEGGARDDGGESVDTSDPRAPGPAQWLSRGATHGVRYTSQGQSALATRAIRRGSKVSTYIVYCLPASYTYVVYTGWKGNKCHYSKWWLLMYKEPNSPYNFFLILIYNELFKFKTSDEWQHWKMGSSSLDCKVINI